VKLKKAKTLKKFLESLSPNFRKVSEKIFFTSRTAFKERDLG
jgi:hypothetical protein